MRSLLSDGRQVARRADSPSALESSVPAQRLFIQRASQGFPWKLGQPSWHRVPRSPRGAPCGCPLATLAPGGCTPDGPAACENGVRFFSTRRISQADLMVTTRPRTRARRKSTPRVQAACARRFGTPPSRANLVIGDPQRCVDGGVRLVACGTPLSASASARRRFQAARIQRFIAARVGRGRSATEEPSGSLASAALRIATSAVTRTD